MKQKVIKLVFSILLPLIVGAVAGIATSSGISDWYMGLNKPVFNPPNWVFGPVWTTLYLVMGVSFFLIWRLPHSRKRNFALRVYFLQLAFNFTWSFLFFYFQQINIAMIEIFVLWCLILWMIIRFYELNRWAAWLNVPYLLWVSFATVLNVAYFILN